jgi:hypothetical protein
MEHLKSIAALSKEKCERMNASLHYINNIEHYVNPLTGASIKKNGDIYNKIIRHYENLLHNRTQYIKQIVDKWIQKPLRDPLNNDKLKLSLQDNTAYVELYHISYEYYQEQNKTPSEIREILPKNHILFNEIDILFYTQNKDNLTDDIIEKEDYYDFIETLIVNMDTPKQNNVIAQYEKNIILNLRDGFVTRLRNYSMYAFMIPYVNFETMGDYAMKILQDINKLEFISNFIDDFDAYSKFAGTLNHSKISNQVSNFLSLETRIPEEGTLYADALVHFIISSGEVHAKLLEYYNEIYNMYNYEKYPSESPFDHLVEKEFRIVEDPLVSMLGKIGLDNIDQESFELPKRTFKNDTEYNEYSEKYNRLKTEYQQKKREWMARNSTVSTNSSPPPEAPLLKLPKNTGPNNTSSDTSINVMIHPLPRHIKDDEYFTIVDTYNKHKKGIEAYKNAGILEILERMGKIDIKDDLFIQNRLIEKSREYFNEYILEDGTDNSDKCNANIDAFTYDNFKDDSYELSKLQLMFMLQTKDDNGEIKRTDCFYTPNLYNHIVRRINNRKVVENIVTKQIVPLTQLKTIITDVMNTMRIFDETLETPEYILPKYDKHLKLEHRLLNMAFGSYDMYYSIFVTRKIGDIDLKILNLCIIPADIQIDDKITTENFLQKITHLFNNGMLFNRYVPPYYNGSYDDPNYIRIQEFIDFTKFNSFNKWPRDQSKKLEMFAKHFKEISKII